MPDRDPRDFKRWAIGQLQGNHVVSPGSPSLYLDELARRARRVLPSAMAESLVAEAAEHLDASIQARLELEGAFETAERDAVAAFGTPKEIVARAASVNRARFQGLFLGGTTATGVGWAFALLASPVLDRVFVVTVGVVFFIQLGCLVEASKHRRPWKPVLAATLVFWLAFTAICAAWARDLTVAGWLSPHPDGPVDVPHAALWAAFASLTFFGYLVLAYRMARPLRPSAGTR